MDADAEQLLQRLLRLPPKDRAILIRGLSPPQQREFNERWWQWAHAGQLWPGEDWRIWLVRAGRGFGKTRAGSEWVSQIARDMPEARIALVGATIEDVRRVMIAGESGLIAVAREREEPEWREAAGELWFPSGARAFAYSAGAPEKLRGPEHHAAWCDELAKWPRRRADAAWDNLMLGLRLGTHPRTLVTTTPKPGKLLKRVMALGDCHETRGRTRDNPWLPASFVEAMQDSYAGTRLGRQELEGELLEDAEGALWTRAGLEAARVDALPERARIVVGVDPPAGTSGCGCGIVAAMLGKDGMGYVIEDASVGPGAPEAWARAVAACAARHGADRVVAEANQGGAMVRSVLLAADAALPLALVRASEGKSARAEPVSLLYARGKVKHRGTFSALEDEMCGLIAGGGYEGPGASPDRADALVWALTELMLGRRGAASVRGL